MQKNSLIST